MAEEFIAGVKGIGYTPGRLGFKDMVFPGRRAMGNLVTKFKGGEIGDYVNDTTKMGTSYWWTLDAKMNPSSDIYDIAWRSHKICKSRKR
jgi:hypothetical protein